MKIELGKVAAGLFSAALVLEGCSPAVSPAPASSPEGTFKSSPGLSVPIDVVDCQKDPMDDQEGKLTLHEGELVRIGGITKAGEQDLVDVTLRSDNTIRYVTENFGLKPVEFPGYVKFEDKNLVVILAPFLIGSETIMTFSVTCADAIPKVPQGPRA